MKILLTNDDGIFAPGLHALEKSLRRLGDVFVAAPSIEQSGISHALTYLKPIHAIKIDPESSNLGMELHGFAIDGTPSDCVRLAVSKLMDEKPDIVVSGLNKGLNAGINVLYSGTVAGAREGSMFGIPSFAVSQEFEPNMDFQKASEIAVDMIERLLSNSTQQRLLYNINVPTVALAAETIEPKIVPMETNRYGHEFEQGIDPGGRKYYWATIDPPPKKNSHETDVMALAKGFVTLTPLGYDLTDVAAMEKLSKSFEHGNQP